MFKERKGDSSFWSVDISSWMGGVRALALFIQARTQAIVILDTQNPSEINLPVTLKQTRV